VVCGNKSPEGEGGQTEPILYGDSVEWSDIKVELSSEYPLVRVDASITLEFGRVSYSPGLTVVLSQDWTFGEWTWVSMDGNPEACTFTEADATILCVDFSLEDDASTIEIFVANIQNPPY